MLIDSNWIYLLLIYIENTHDSSQFRKELLYYWIMFETLNVWMNMFMAIIIFLVCNDFLNFLLHYYVFAIGGYENYFHSQYVVICPGQGPWVMLWMKCIINAVMDGFDGDGAVTHMLQ